MTEPGLPLTTGEGAAGDPEASLLCLNKEHHDLAADCARLQKQLDAAQQQLKTTRYERDAVYAVNAAANYDRANAAEDALQEVVALCEPDRIPLPLLNSRILRVARAALEAVGRADTGNAASAREEKRG